MEHGGLWSLIRIVVFFFLFSSLCGSLSCEGQKGTELKSRTNSPPVITSVSILLEKPSKESDLSLSIQSQDEDGDPITYQYQWVKNDAELPGEKKEILKSGNFKKGDLIQVRVTPSDGKVDGKPVLSSTVKILNSPPVMQEIGIDPKVAYANDPLKVHLKGFDADGDFIYYTYRWEKNEVVLSEEGTEALESGRFKKGDSISVTVIPDDREDKGLPKKSEPVVIANSPPIIISSPPTSIEGMTYLYQVKALDPDHDPVQFTLKSGPKGMVIDKETGLIRWEVRKEDKGTYPIEIEASDNEGAKSIQRYTLTVDYK